MLASTRAPPRNSSFRSWWRARWAPMLRISGLGSQVTEFGGCHGSGSGWRPGAPRAPDERARRGSGWRARRSPPRRGPAVDAAGAGGGDPLDVLDLADRPQLLGAVGAVHRARLDEHGRATLARPGRRYQLVELVLRKGIPRAAYPRSGGEGHRSVGPARGSAPRQGEPVVAAVGMGRLLRGRVTVWTGITGFRGSGLVGCRCRAAFR